MPELVIGAETRLKACPERAAGIDWPMPLDQRLDELCDLADDEGAETSRKELAAALVFAAPSSPVRLKALIDKYRKAKAREAAVTPDGQDRVLTIRPRHAGRRSRRIPATVQGA